MFYGHPPSRPHWHSVILGLIWLREQAETLQWPLVKIVSMLRGGGGGERPGLAGGDLVGAAHLKFINFYDTT